MSLIFIIAVLLGHKILLNRPCRLCAEGCPPNQNLEKAPMFFVVVVLGYFFAVTIFVYILSESGKLFPNIIVSSLLLFDNPSLF